MDIVKWTLVVITWYPPHAEVAKTQLELPTESRCEEIRTKTAGRYEQMQKTDPNFQFIVGECLAVFADDLKEEMP